MSLRYRPLLSTAMQRRPENTGLHLQGRASTTGLRRRGEGHTFAPLSVQALVLRHGAFYLRGPRAEALCSWQYVGAFDSQSRPTREKQR